MFSRGDALLDVVAFECNSKTHITTLSIRGLTTVKNIGTPVMRTYTVIGGLAVGPRQLGVNNKDVNTLEASIAERVLRYRKGGNILLPLVPVKGSFTQLQRFKNRLLNVYGDFPTPLAPSEFVAMYTGRKRAIYESAAGVFEADGVKFKHSFIKAFVKAEKVNLEKAPRCIQPRNPIYNVGLGIYLKHIEHYVYRAIARVFRQRIVVSKGLNVKDLGNYIAEIWGEIDEPVFVGLDASRFDMHVSQDALRWEHSIYLSLYNYDPALKRLLDMQLVNKGTGWCPDGKVKYKTKGCRMSGDMNTALGNCLLMCGMVHTYLSEYKIRYRFINNGDDCGVILSKKDLHVFQGVEKSFEQWGFRMEVEPPVEELEQIVFCQMQPVYTPKGYIMVRNVFAALEKDSMSIVPLKSRKMLRKWVYSVGECGLSLCSGIPVLQEFYSMYMRVGLPSSISSATYMECGARYLAVGLQSKWKLVSDESRMSFYKAFKVLPQDQVTLERYYANINNINMGDVLEMETIPGIIPSRIDC